MKLKHLTTLALGLLLSCAIVTPGFAKDNLWIKVINMSSSTIYGVNDLATVTHRTDDILPLHSGQSIFRRQGMGYIGSYRIYATQNHHIIADGKGYDWRFWALDSLCLGSTILVTDKKAVQVAGPRYPNCK